ncbi:MAG: AbrB/MazE/SpoVT family DNA-binding domain-containing protein [Nitrospirales bacterium]|nr:AbrB/MazE/SpoVT family DNA-binding domain-containing protein [Nitrospirales bacterium]
MVTKVQKWGNSQGLRFPKALLEDAHVKVGDAVHVSVQGQKIIIEPLKKIRGKYDLRALVSKVPKGYQVEEVAWGTPLGKEEW